MNRWIIYLFGMVLLTTGCSTARTADLAAGKTQNPSGEISALQDQYIIGPEDILDIFVWKEEAVTKTVPVRIDGQISLPLVNDIQAAGLTPLQLKEVIAEKLKNYIENPTVTVTVIEANSYKIFITGEVRNPGVMRIRSQTTLLKVITSVGGFTEWANKRSILIITTDEKGEEKRTTVNYNRIVDGKDPDPVIHRGDTIVVR